jgi:glycolate oxidase FAD binding subunit
MNSAPETQASVRDCDTPQLNLGFRSENLELWRSNLGFPAWSLSFEGRNSAFRTRIEGLGDIAGQGEALTVLRLEGITASAAHRAGSLRELLAPFGTATLVEDVASAALWATIRDVLPFAADGALGAWPVWRIVCPPASGAALGTLLARETGGELIYDWGGGLIWAAVPPKPDAHATAVRERVNAAGGHATLIRAAEDIRRAIDVFHPQAPGLAALSERVRASFDPKTILNRGRLTRDAC